MIDVEDYLVLLCDFFTFHYRIYMCKISKYGWVGVGDRGLRLNFIVHKSDEGTYAIKSYRI